MAMVRNSVGSGPFDPLCAGSVGGFLSRLTACVCVVRLLRCGRAAGFSRRPQGESGEHRRGGTHGDGRPAVRDEGEGRDPFDSTSQIHTGSYALTHALTCFSSPLSVAPRRPQAARETSPELFTIATLTGHAIRAMGPNYSVSDTSSHAFTPHACLFALSASVSLQIIMDNGPAHRNGNAAQWQKGEKCSMSA